MASRSVGLSLGITIVTPTDDRTILLEPTVEEMQSDGRRVSVKYRQRWRRNLEGAIMEALLKVPEEGAELRAHNEPVTAGEMHE